MKIVKLVPQKCSKVGSWKNKALEKLYFSGDFCKETLGLLPGVEILMFMVIYTLHVLIRCEQRTVGPLLLKQC